MMKTFAFLPLVLIAPVFLKGAQRTRCSRTPGVLIRTPLYTSCTSMYRSQDLTAPGTWLGVYQAPGSFSPLCFLERQTPLCYPLFPHLHTDFALGRAGGHRRGVETCERPARGGDGHGAGGVKAQSSAWGTCPAAPCPGVCGDRDQYSDTWVCGAAEHSQWNQQLLWLWKGCEGAVGEESLFRFLFIPLWQLTGMCTSLPALLQERHRYVLWAHQSWGAESKAACWQLPEIISITYC